MYDTIILGSGPAGLTAAIYTGRAKKSTLVLTGASLGGQTGEIAKLEKAGAKNIENPKIKEEIFCRSTHEPSGKIDVVSSEQHSKKNDKEETVKARLEAYHKQTQPLIDFYNERGILKEVDGTVSMNEVFNSIVSILG
mgnify:CR=1 FL=1